MNAERLHALANALSRDLNTTKTVSGLNSLKDALQNQVNQPNQPQHQQAVAEHLRRLHAALVASETNSWSPAWTEAAKEVGAWKLTGERLADSLTDVFERNQITPQVALDEVGALHSKANELQARVNHLTAGLSGFGIGAEDLEPGQAELGVIVPRREVSNELKAFSKELSRLDRTFGVFSELATGGRDGFQLKTISSSDLSVFLEVSPQVAACAAIAIERVVALYRDLLEIRKLRQELAERGVNDSNLSGIESHAESHMAVGIGGLVDELLKRFYTGKDKGRRNELKKDLGTSLNEIANRVDRGFRIEVRVEPLPEPDEEQDKDPTADELRQHFETVQAAQEGLQFFRAEGEPILQLPESVDPDEQTTPRKKPRAKKGPKKKRGK